MHEQRSHRCGSDGMRSAGLGFSRSIFAALSIQRDAQGDEHAEVVCENQRSADNSLEAYRYVAVSIRQPQIRPSAHLGGHINFGYRGLAASGLPPQRSDTRLATA